MASNSKREQILTKVETLLGEIPAITTVRRVPFNELNQIDNASTEMPVAVVMGALPQPEEKFSGRTRKLDRVVSDLLVSVLVYAEDNETPDSTISTLADDIWAKFYADITLGFNWVRGLVIVPEQDTMVAAPYVIFKMDIKVKYDHDWRGI